MRRRVIRGRHPHRSAAALPRVAVLRHRCLLGGNIALQVFALAGLLGEVPFPSLVRQCVERPHRLAVILVVRPHEAADSILRPRAADDNRVVDDQRCNGQAVARLGIGDFHIPLHCTRLRIERHETRVERAHIHSAARDRDATVVRSATVDRRRDAWLVLVPPDLLARTSIDRNGRVVRSRHVHHAVDDGRTVLEGSKTRDARLIHPRHPQGADVRARDLRERRVALVRVVAAVDRPVLSVRTRVLQHVIGDVRKRRLAHRDFLRIRLYLLLRAQRGRERKPGDDESHSTSHAHAKTSGKHVGGISPVLH